MLLCLYLSLLAVGAQSVLLGQLGVCVPAHLYNQVCVCAQIYGQTVLTESGVCVLTESGVSLPAQL